MPHVDTEDFKAALNADPEFKIAARFWNGVVRVGLGEQTYILTFRDGQLESMIEPAGDNFMTQSRHYNIEIYAPAHEWQNLFEETPRPFYQDLFAAITKHDFRYGGDMKMFFAYYPALRRLFKLMGSFTTVLQEAK